MAYNFKDVEVLVVESSVPMFKLVKDVLNIFSVPEKNIYSAYDVDDAFRKFCQSNHDLIIVDWLQNPDHGIKLTQMIRTNKKTPNAFVPIIMTSGSGHLSRVLRARDSGVSEYLVKPFSAKSLAERVTRVIENPRPIVVCETFTGPDRRTGKWDADYTGPERRVNVIK
jgi:two-component system chemotaxis response regulator CheY